ncbi:hypothetical protein D9Q98_008912 [Chlorella vulgaris]|uniref:Uncharacterized protein n=1 Tax=Chlorella vulgaris TaxID=3077 RepID=A0A9D4TGR6_CHLVU|nr:hypothetical protein D9Q98_008912 [Chlorella vulgaris]
MPVPSIFYLLVADEPSQADEGSEYDSPLAAPPRPTSPFLARYTQSLLRQTLQLMGCKPRQSDKAAQKVFLIVQQRAALPPGEALSLAGRLHTAAGGHAGVTISRLEFDQLVMDCLAAANKAQMQPEQRDVQQELGRQALPAIMEQPQHGQAAAAAVPSAAAAAAATAAAAVDDFRIACTLREQRTSVAVLLCGTSGTGKSTLAALLAARLGISTVVSTDSIRHMMRSFSSESEDPLLWASTYEAGAHLQAARGAALAQAAAQLARAPSQRQQQQQGGEQQQQVPEAGPPSQVPYLQLLAGGAAASASDPRKAAILGYKAQSARVLEHVDRLLTGCEARRQSIVVEGVHLSLSMVVRMMQRHPSVVPFLVHISNDAKHMERFAVRSKVMTLRPDGNRYVKYFRNIRAIQDYLVKSADKHAIPKVDNTNVDRSVATIHTTVLGCLRRAARGESMLAGTSLSCKLVLEEYLRCQSATWSSSDMLDLIRRKSAAGHPPSPSEAASSTREATTPRGTGSQVAAEEQLWLGSWQGATAPAARRGMAHDEGDHRSFFGSDSQSSSGTPSGTTSCSCSDTSSGSEYGEEEQEEPKAAAHVYSNGSFPGSRGAGTQPCESPGRGSGSNSLLAGAQQQGGTDVLGSQDLPPRRPRHRERRHWRGQRYSGSPSEEIPSGLGRQVLRRRSEVGSVLEPEPHSDTEDVELASAVLVPQ